MAGAPYPTIPITGAVSSLGGATVPANVTSPPDAAITWTTVEEVRLRIFDRVGDPAANRMHIEADKRTRTILEIVRWLTANSNALDRYYLRRDGSTQEAGGSGMTAALPMNGFKITGLHDGSDPTDAAAYGQLTGGLDLKVDRAGDTMTGSLTMSGAGIRLTNQQALQWKNAANTAFINLLTLWSDDAFYVGSGVAGYGTVLRGDGVDLSCVGTGNIRILSPINWDITLRNNRTIWGNTVAGAARTIACLAADGVLYIGDYRQMTKISGADIHLLGNTILAGGQGLYGTDASDGTTHLLAYLASWDHCVYVGDSATGTALNLMAPRDPVHPAQGAVVQAYDGYIWSRMWHSENDGADSGLDADLLDGLHAGQIGGYNYAVLTGSASWQVPSGVTRIIALIWGAGGGGGGGGGGDDHDGYGGAGGGGGAGGPCDLVETDVTPLSWLAYSCGAAGLGGAGGLARKRGYSGTAGGSTTFKGYTVPGGAYGHGGHDGGADAAPPPDPAPPQNAGGVSYRNSGSGGNGGDGGNDGGWSKYPGAAGSAGETVRWNPTGNRSGLGGAQVVQNGSGGGGGGGGAPACPLAIGGHPGYAGAGGQGGWAAGSGAAGGPATGTAAGGGGGGGGGDEDGLGGAGGNGVPGVIVILW